MRREGRDVTLLAYGPMVKTCLDAAAAAADEGRDQEPDGEGYDIGFHGKTSRHGKERAAPDYSAASLFAATGSRRWPCLTRSGALWTIV